MTEPAILYEADAHVIRLTFNRTRHKNSIDTALLMELGRILDGVERERANVITLSGQGGYFSSGMDFAEVAETGVHGAGEEVQESCALYFRILRRLASIPKVVVAQIEGKVLAGGIGLVAASDLAVAAPGASFGLPEILWGMLPAMVLPFLIRRMGYHRAYKLALTSLTVDASKALDMGLVDEVDENPERPVRRLVPRLGRLDPQSIGRLKRYYNDISFIDGRIEEMAVRTTASLTMDPQVRQRISDFVHHNTLPWERNA